METKTTRGVKTLLPTTVNNLSSSLPLKKAKSEMLFSNDQTSKNKTQCEHTLLPHSISHSLSLCKKSNQLWIVCYGVGRGGGDCGAPREAARQRTKRGGDSGKQRQRKREKWQGRANKYECGLCRLG